MSHGSHTLYPWPFSHSQEDNQPMSKCNKGREVETACYGGWRRKKLPLWRDDQSCPGDCLWFPGSYAEDHLWLLPRSWPDCFLLLLRTCYLLLPFAKAACHLSAGWGSAGPGSRFRTCFQPKEGGWVCRGPYSREDQNASRWRAVNQGLPFDLYHGRYLMLTDLCRRQV